MRISKTTLGLSFGVACAWGLVACSDGDVAPTIPSAGAGGASGASHAAGAAGKGGANAGGPAAGAAGEDNSEGGATVVGGAGGETSGSGGAPGGAGASGGAATAGMGGGGAPPIVPLTVVIDSWFIRPKGSTAGNAGAGGAGGAGGGAGTAGGGAGGLGGGGASGGGASGGAAGGASGGGAGGLAGGGAGGTAGAGLGGGGAGGISGGGAGGALSVPGVTRIYPFDTDTMPWVLNPYGSTPGIGNQGGAEKLSALSMLGLNATEGSPAPKSAQIIAPFSMGSEQLDMNQGVAPEEDWTGFEVVAKIKVVTAGHTPSSCMGAWLYTTSDGYVFGRGPEVFLSPDKGWINLRFDLDAPSAYMEDHGTQDAFDKTRINQVGLQLETFRCP